MHGEFSVVRVSALTESASTNGGISLYGVGETGVRNTGPAFISSLAAVVDMHSSAKVLKHHGESETEHLVSVHRTRAPKSPDEKRPPHALLSRQWRSWRNPVDLQVSTFFFDRYVRSSISSALQWVLRCAFRAWDPGEAVQSQAYGTFLCSLLCSACEEIECRGARLHCHLAREQISIGLFQSDDEHGHVE